MTQSGNWFDHNGEMHCVDKEAERSRQSNWFGKPQGRMLGGFLFLACCSEIHFYLLVIIDLTIAGQNIAVGDPARPVEAFSAPVDCSDDLDLRGGFGTNTAYRNRGI
jgi:hypothetical protein